MKVYTYVILLYSRSDSEEEYEYVYKNWQTVQQHWYESLPIYVQVPCGSRDVDVDADYYNVIYPAKQQKIVPQARPYMPIITRNICKHTYTVTIKQVKKNGKDNFELQ
jgi:hypothetical protein